MCSAVIPLHSSLGMSTFMIFCWFRSLLFDIEGIEGWKYYRCQLSVMNFIRCYYMIPNCIDFDVWYSLSHFIMRKLSGNSFLFNFLSDECQPFKNLQLFTIINPLDKQIFDIYRYVFYIENECSLGGTSIYLSLVIVLTSLHPTFRPSTPISTSFVSLDINRLWVFCGGVKGVVNILVQEPSGAYSKLKALNRHLNTVPCLSRKKWEVLQL